MKIILVILLILFSTVFGYSISRDKLTDERPGGKTENKEVILRFALVSDSHNENELLASALNQAKGKGINFVIGLGDWSLVGTQEELLAAKKVFDNSGLEYFVGAGDRDLWDSRNRGIVAHANFANIFGEQTQIFTKNMIQFVILDNSDIYKGISDSDWLLLDSLDSQTEKLNFVFSHKSPFHPQSGHIMGEDSETVAVEAKRYLTFLENNNIDGFFSGDLHFFAQFQSPNNAVKITTSGAASASRNFQGPRYEIVTVYEDYSWKVDDFAIR